MAIQFICPKCENEITVRYLKVGNEFKCRKCGQRGIIPEAGEEVIIINSDDTDQFKSAPINSQSEISDNKTNKKFPAVRLLSVSTKIGAWIIFGTLIFFGVLSFIEKNYIIGTLWFAGGISYLIWNLAFAEILLVILAIEENTSKNHEQ